MRCDEHEANGCECSGAQHIPGTAAGCCGGSHAPRAALSTCAFNRTNPDVISRGARRDNSVHTRGLTAQGGASRGQAGGASCCLATDQGCARAAADSSLADRPQCTVSQGSSTRPVRLWLRRVSTARRHGEAASGSACNYVGLIAGGRSAHIPVPLFSSKLNRAFSSRRTICRTTLYTKQWRGTRARPPVSAFGLLLRNE